MCGLSVANIVYCANQNVSMPLRQCADGSAGLRRRRRSDNLSVRPGGETSVVPVGRALGVSVRHCVDICGRSGKYQRFLCYVRMKRRSSSGSKQITFGPGCCTAKRPVTPLANLGMPPTQPPAQRATLFMSRCGVKIMNEIFPSIIYHYIQDFIIQNHPSEAGRLCGASVRPLAAAGSSESWQLPPGS